MTPLRQQMIDAMTVRGFSPKTHRSYLFAVTDLASYYRRSPDRITIEELRAWFLYLVKERRLSAASCRLYLNGVKFFYRQVLKRAEFDVDIPVPRRAQRIPELLTRSEVRAIIDVCTPHKHQMMLMTCYGCGLRVSELVRLRLRDIDGERSVLRIEQGKGNKDRLVTIPATLLTQLRQYWQGQRPSQYLFPRYRQWEVPLGVSTAQKAFMRAKLTAGIDKIGGIHSLRHAWATASTGSGPRDPPTAILDGSS
ncbi:MAG: integrase/recombinase XerD [Gammaproteobacteria bacterium]|jgi:integrase/recombinase XerD